MVFDANYLGGVAGAFAQIMPSRNCIGILKAALLRGMHEQVLAKNTRKLAGSNQSCRLARTQSHL